MSFPASSKTTVNPFTTQAPNVQRAKPKGGWADDDDANDLFTNPNLVSFTGSNVTQLVKPNLNIFTGNKFLPESAKVVESNETENKANIMTCDEAFFNKHAHEIKIINEAVQPGGARLKQSDTVLNEICRACESMQVDVVGSILFHNLSNSTGLITKARTLFIIDTLVRRLRKFNVYFSSSQKTLNAYTFTEEGNVNAAQLKKIRDDIFNSKGASVQQVSTPATSVSTSKVASTPVQSAQNSSVVLNGNSGSSLLSGVKKPVSTVPSQLLNSQAQHQTANNQAPQTAQLPSQAKPNPFGITTPAPNSAVTSKPSSGLPGAFKNMLAKNQDASVVSPSSSVSQNSVSTPASTQSQNSLSNQQKALQQVVQNPKESADSIMNSLAGLNFNDQENHQYFNGNYPMNPNQYGYNGSNSMTYPQDQDPNMMGYPGAPQYNYPSQSQCNYPNSQFNGNYGGPYNVPQYPQYNSQFQGQHQQNYDPSMNFQMQQQQMYYQGHYMNQNNYQYNQPDPEQEEAQREEMNRKEQKRLEELRKKKQQEENERRFESLSYNM